MGSNSDSCDRKFKYANDPKTRQAAQQAFDDRLAINVEHLNTALRLRRQIAEILQYDSWADYITEEKMVKSAANAKQVRHTHFRDPCLYPSSIV